ncbi:MAG: hypothetical protein IT314_00105 [Anaerolineales bacterium]|nr:hypothetical protein [Anaerolineales bacterium]
MRNRIAIVVLCIFALGLLSISISSKKGQDEIITISVHGSLETKTIDDLIDESELIVIGTVDTILPSRWKVPGGELPRELSVNVILENRISIVTDHLISIERLLKGSYQESVVRVRAFKGEIDQVRFVSSSEPSYELGQSYVLFLMKDHGPTQIVDPGDFIPVNAIGAVYEIIDDKAISIDDQWLLEDLIAYIEKSLSGEAPAPTESPPLPTETILPPTEAPILTDTPTSTP